MLYILVLVTIINGQTGYTATRYKDLTLAECNAEIEKQKLDPSKAICVAIDFE